MADISKYSFCRENGEHLAGFHIRKFGPAGRSDYLVDTPALCGKRIAYDLNTEITESTLVTEDWRLCPSCNVECRASVAMSNDKVEV